MKRIAKVKGRGLGSGFISYWCEFEFEIRDDDTESDIRFKAKRKMVEKTACDHVEIESIEISSKLK
jgi:hypothetical protein